MPVREAIDFLSVSQYAGRIARTVAGMGEAFLIGEVQNLSVHTRGHLFFSVSDGRSTLAATMFAGDVERIPGPRPVNGDLVKLRVKRPDLYAATGKLSLIVDFLRVAGDGELLAAREALLGRLVADGLCDERRRPALPAFPRRVGVIAGRDSDALADVLAALTARWPPVRILVHPALVQGVRAAGSMIDALGALSGIEDVDVIVLARGGGSVQDLVPFDDEGLCRAIAALEVPVICAVGHTRNQPAVNHVTWNVPVPARAADLAVPSVTEVRRRIHQAGATLEAAAASVRDRRVVLGRLAGGLDARRRLEHLELRLAQRVGAIEGPARRRLDERAVWLGSARSTLNTAAGGASIRILGDRHRLAELRRAHGAGARQVTERRRVVEHLGALVHARDPRRVGWTLTLGEHGQPVASITGLAAGDRLQLQFEDGEAVAVVESIAANGEASASRPEIRP